jgi:hypothetical protein
MSLPEEAGKVAGSVVDAIKARPDFLVLLVLVLFLSGATVYGRKLVEERHQMIVSELIERCMEPSKR